MPAGGSLPLLVLWQPPAIRPCWQTLLLKLPSMTELPDFLTKHSLQQYNAGVLRVSCAALARPLARATFVDSRAIDRSMEQPKLSSPLNKNVLFHSGVAGFWLRK